jgi:hypothetical protein
MTAHVLVSFANTLYGSKGRGHTVLSLLTPTVALGGWCVGRASSHIHPNG